MDYQFNNANDVGTWTVRVNNPGGKSSNTLSFDVTAGADPPSISEIVPSSYQASDANQVMTINGSGFQRDATLTFVRPGGHPKGSTDSKLTFVSSGRIDYKFNNGSETGTWAVVVNNPNGASSNSVKFNVTSDPLPPLIREVVPSSYRPSNEEQAMTINGNNFTSGATLTLVTPGGEISTTSSLTFISSSQLRYEFNNRGEDGTWTVRVNNPDGQSSTAVSIAVSDVGEKIFVGGIEFSADAVAHTATGYELSGPVSMNGVVTYTGTLAIVGPDSSGKFMMRGVGDFKVPGVTIPGVGVLTIYSGTFELPFQHGKILNFLESYSRVTIAGWKIRIDELSFVPQGVQIAGSLRIPQYLEELSAVGVATTVEATTTGGVRLIGGSVRIDRLVLAGGFQLRGINVLYEPKSNSFSGSGTIWTPALKFAVDLAVIDGCPNGASATILGKPILVPHTPLQIVNYGVEGTGLCGRTPFGIGLHTDVTFVGVPDADLISLKRVSATYSPIATIHGSGRLRFLNTDLISAELFVNYSDTQTNCEGGVCLSGLVKLPNASKALLVGRLNASVLGDPFRMHGEGRLLVQMPTRCNDLDLPVLLCLLINSKCDGVYPCPLSEVNMTLSVQPGARPEATFSGLLLIGHSAVGLTVEYNRNGDKDFTFRLGAKGDESSGLKVTVANQNYTEAIISEGTTDYYFVMETPAGTTPVARLTGPDGDQYTITGGPGVRFYADAELGAGAFALLNPKPGRWRLDVLVGTVSFEYTPSRRPAVNVKHTTTEGSRVRIVWNGSSPGGAALVALTYATVIDGPDRGVIATGLMASGNDQTTFWDTREVPPGSYYVRARISLSDNGLSASYTADVPVEISGNGTVAPPSGLQFKSLSPGSAALSWGAGPNAIAGYVVVTKIGGTGSIIEKTVGNVLTHDLTGLDPDGGYEVWAIAYDEQGQRSEPSNKIRLSWSGCNPSVVAIVPETTAKGDSVKFSAASATPGCLGTTSYLWRFGDGAATSTAAQPEHVYKSTGVYSWTLEAVTDLQVATAMGTIRVDEQRCLITVHEPTASQLVQAGRLHVVRWSTEGACGSEFHIELGREDQVETLARNLSHRQLEWTPSSTAAGPGYTIRVSDARNREVMGVSQVFSIAPTSSRKRAVGRRD
jgi:hypothetical protein